MKVRYFTRLSFLAIAIIFFIWSAQALADSATLEYEAQGLDLDTGIVTEQTPGLPDSTEGADVLIGYHADRTPHAVMMTAGEGVTLAVMSGVSYDSVTTADTAGLNFSAEFIDQPLEATDTVLVKTDAGATFKIGNVSETDMDVTLDYEQLQ